MIGLLHGRETFEILHNKNLALNMIFNGSLGAFNVTINNRAFVLNTIEYYFRSVFLLHYCRLFALAIRRLTIVNYSSCRLFFVFLVDS